jgi:EAL and modified HD-GYP domain-containing signal transduction protein
MERKQLQKWLQLLLYTSGHNEDSLSATLTQAAVTRGKLMELIATIERPHDKNHHERAFMVGILSLLDELLGIDIHQIVDKLGISDEMSQALLARQGRLGKALKLVEANEKSDIASIHATLAELGFLTLDELTDLEAQAIEWASRMKTAETIN